MVKLQKD